MNKFNPIKDKVNNQISALQTTNDCSKLSQLVSNREKFENTFMRTISSEVSPNCLWFSIEFSEREAKCDSDSPESFYYEGWSQ